MSPVSRNWSVWCNIAAAAAAVSVSWRPKFSYGTVNAWLLIFTLGMH